MKKIKLAIVILAIISIICYLYYDTSNETIEDALIQDAATGSLSEPEYIIDSITVDDIIMCIYQTKDGRLGYSTINYKNRSYSKYIVCTNENIDKSSLRTDKTIIRNYDNMGLNYMYGIVVNPTGDRFSYNGHTHTLHICTYGNIRIGYFLETS